MNKNDLILRQDIIDAIEEVTWYHLHNGEMVEGANSKEVQPWYKSEDIYKAIENIPTFEGEPILYWRGQMDGCLPFQTEVQHGEIH